MAEYSRFLEGSQQAFARQKGPAEWLHLDLSLLLPVTLVMALGLVILYSASGEDWDAVTRQARNFGVGWLVLLITAQLRIDTIQRWSGALYVFALLLLCLVLIFGVGAKGAQRWLSLGFIRFQPSEIMKIAMPLAVAAWVVRRGLPPRIDTTLVLSLIHI